MPTHRERRASPHNGPAAASSVAPHLRVSDGEREDVVRALREHAAQGRLDFAELDERLEVTYAARTRADLQAPMHDLPAVTSPRYPADRQDAKRRALTHHARSYALVMLGLIVVWAISGGDYFWPVWPMFGWGIGLASHGSQVLRPAELRRGLRNATSGRLGA